MSRKTKTKAKSRTISKSKKKNKPKIYRRRNPLKIILVTLGCILLAAIILFLILFFSLKKHIVYTDDGVKLDIPWLEEYRNTDNIDFVY